MHRTYSLLLIVLAALLGGCGKKEAPPAPTVRPIGDNKEWALTEEMVYTLGNTGTRIVVPRGFVTDFASIPQRLWSIGLSPHGQYSRAAVVHDYLYWAQPCTREQADRLLVVAMKESKVDGFDEWAVYNGVAIFGNGPWEQNAKERALGLPRVIPEAHLRPKDPNMSWKEYRSLLAAQGVRDPAFESNPDYCKYGNKTEVPSSSSAPSAS